MREERAHAAAAVAKIAARQHGIVTFAQLKRAGVDKSGVARRVAAGHLHRIHRGVYAVGHEGLGNHGRWMAAVLACGSGATLSHRAAAELWRLLDPAHGEVDITVPTRAGRKQRDGLHVHRSRLPRRATVIVDAIRVTTPARTLIDLRRVAAPDLYRRALRQAEFRGLNLTGLHTDGTRSEPEAEFLRLCRRYRLPMPEVNRRIGPYTADFLWRADGVVVEVDGWTAHRGRQAFEDDHGRDLFLLARGYAVLRFTARQIRDDPAAVAAAVRQALQSSGRWVPPRA